MKMVKLNGQTMMIYSIFALLFMGCIWATIHALKPVNTNDYEVITVHSGDTLWGIANDYKDETSITSFVNWVEDVNHVQSENIKIGDQLVIPVKKNLDSEKHHYELASK